MTAYQLSFFGYVGLLKSHKRSPQNFQFFGVRYTHISSKEQYAGVALRDSTTDNALPWNPLVRHLQLFF
jgi:hypothetical protein